MPGKAREKPKGSLLWLRRRDQAVIAGATLLGLAALAWHWRQAGGFSGDLVELESSVQRSYTFQADINRAAWPELAQLPGIGETLARRIVESRESAGPFANHEDLRRVHGIGPKKLAAIRQYLAPIGPP